MREEHTERLSTDLTREQRLNLAATQQKPEMEIYGCRKFEDRDNVDGIGQKHYEEHHIHKRYWRRGFAKEAARAVRDWAFLNTEYHELYSYMKYTNEGSWRTALANGMKKVKEYPDPKNTISYAFSITREEWMRQQRFDCTFDDLSVDNELNQILKATAIALIRCPEVDLKRKQELRLEMLFFSSVADIDASHMQWGRLLFHRNNRSYEMLMNICQIRLA